MASALHAACTVPAQDVLVPICLCCTGAVACLTCCMRFGSMHIVDHGLRACVIPLDNGRQVPILHSSVQFYQLPEAPAPPALLPPPKSLDAPKAPLAACCSRTCPDNCCSRMAGQSRTSPLRTWCAQAATRSAEMTYGYSLHRDVTYALMQVLLSIKRFVVGTHCAALPAPCLRQQFAALSPRARTGQHEMEGAP